MRHGQVLQACMLSLHPSSADPGVCVRVWVPARAGSATWRRRGTACKRGLRQPSHVSTSSRISRSNTSEGPTAEGGKGAVALQSTVSRSLKQQ